MKLKFVVFILLIIQLCYSNDKPLFINKNDKATFSGFLITEELLNEFKNTEDQLGFEVEKSLAKDELILKQEKEIKLLTNLKEEYETKIQLTELKLQVQSELSDLYKTRADSFIGLELKLNTYKFTTYLCLGISIAELLGFGSFMLAYYIKD